MIKKHIKVKDMQKLKNSLTPNDSLMPEAQKRRIRRTLAAHKLRNTKCRTAVLRQFMKNDKALSHSELEKTLKEFDRVTIYRTINSFLEKGLIHRVPDNSGTMRYALCPHNCSPEEHQHDHVHFQCNVCGTTQCLNQPVPEISLPEGYLKEEVNFLVEGICKNCQN